MFGQPACGHGYRLDGWRSDDAGHARPVQTRANGEQLQTRGNFLTVEPQGWLVYRLNVCRVDGDSSGKQSQSSESLDMKTCPRCNVVLAEQTVNGKPWQSAIWSDVIAAYSLCPACQYAWPDETLPEPQYQESFTAAVEHNQSQERAA